jgi:3-oxoacyl-[acyl-carrier-protein] synthase II
MISPLGVTLNENWENLLCGVSGIRRITKFDPSNCLTKIGGQLPDRFFELEKANTPKRLYKQTVRATRIMRMTARDAMSDASIEEGTLDPYRCGVVIGTTGSSVRSPDDLGGPGSERFTVIREMTNAPAAWVSIDHGFKGPSFTLSAACSSSSHAVAVACHLLRSGQIDLAVAGGADNLLSENNIRRGNLANVLSRDNEAPEKAMRPFDEKRNGFVISDGGCALVLESYDHAVKRDARVYGWIKGYSCTSDVQENDSSMQPSVHGMAQTMEMALNDAQVSKKEIGYVSANGIATVDGDRLETMALKRAFGSHAYDLSISSLKSMIGHTFGGAGAIEVAATVLALKTKKVPPTINLNSPDPECDLNYVPNSMAEMTNLEAALSHSWAFGGHCCVIVLTESP